MKTPKLFTLIILLTLSFSNCGDRRAVFADNIKKYIKGITKPWGSESLVSNFDTKLTLLIYTLTLKQLDEVKIKFGLSNNLINQIKSAPFARASGCIKVGETTKPNYYTYEETIGSAIKEDDGRISFALIKTQAFAELKSRYDKFYTRSCSRTFIFFKECHNIEHLKLKNISPSEQIIINKAAKYAAVRKISEGADILKKGDFELYMTDTQSIFSPDRKSVAHLTYFGYIAIGPVSELNAVLPLKYQYVNSDAIKKKHNFGENKLVKFPTGAYTDEYSYPTFSKEADLALNLGLFHKFNFVSKFVINEFPGDYIRTLKERGESGPYVLELKKNGNLILYRKKDNYYLWQSNTNTPGVKGPFNLHLRNDKVLVLEDSNGKILYQSKQYKDVPTIYYSSSTRYGKHVYNGLILNKLYFQSKLNFANIFKGGNVKWVYEEVRTPIYLNKLHIKTANDRKYRLVYGGRILGTNNWFYYDNKGNYNPGKYNGEMRFNMFYATLSGGNNDYKICYTVRLNDIGWTSIACDGNKVGVEFERNTIWGIVKNRRHYIENIIIYVTKSKMSFIPVISKNPAIIKN